MRLLYINSSLMDIDEDTSIGIDFQAYDLKEPAKRKVNISNAFTIPKTANNMAVLGHPGNPHSLDDTIYTIMTCDYWIDNYHIINNGVVRFESTGNRINLYLTNKNTIWDDLKLLTWDQFVSEYIVWLKDVKGITTEQVGDDDFATFIAPFTTSLADIVLPFYYGNFLNSTVEAETSTKIVLSYTQDIPPVFGFSYGFLQGGGHFCAYSKSIFEFLEYKYSVNFCTQEVGVVGNIWQDTVAPTVYTPLRDLCVVPIVTYSPIAVTGYKLLDYYYAYFQEFHPIFNPLNDVKDKDSKTMYDYVMAFLMKFNAMADEIVIGNDKAIRIARFDDIKTLATVKDYSNKIQSIESFKSSLDGYSQNNYIKVKALYPEASENFFSKVIPCLNKNLEIKSDLISIDEYISNFKAITDGIIPDLSIQESFKTFEFFVSTGTTTDDITIKVKNTIYDALSIAHDIHKTATANLFIPAHYALTSEYVFLQEIIQKPKVYTIKKWLTLGDIYELEFFKQYYIRELNGSFYINKITGFNPQKSNEPTTIELIRISNKTPDPDYLSDYYVDGNDDYFTDGNGNYFY